MKRKDKNLKKEVDSITEQLLDEKRRKLNAERLDSIRREILEITENYDSLELIAAICHFRAENHLKLNSNLMYYFIGCSIKNINNCKCLPIDVDVVNRVINLLLHYGNSWYDSNIIKAVEDKQMKNIEERGLSATLHNSYNDSNIESYYKYDYHLTKFLRMIEPIKGEIDNLLGFNIDDIPKYISTINIFNYITEGSKLLNYLEKSKNISLPNKEEFYFNISSIISEYKIDYNSYDYIKYILDESKLTNKSLISELYIELDKYDNQMKKFLDLFSYNINDTDIDLQVFDFADVMKYTPIIKIKDNYFIPDGRKVFLAIEEVIERNIISDKKLEAKYRKIKSDFLEDEGISLLKEVLPEGTIYKNVYYKNLEGNISELDGIIKYDKTIILIEAKARNYKDLARQGVISKTENSISRNIIESVKKLNECKALIENNQVTTFTDKNKNVLLDITNQKFQNIFFISLTYENFYEMSSLLQVLKTLGYIEEEENLPWCVSLNDLKVICDFLTNPLEFLHYAYKRSTENNYKLLSDNIILTYELDFLGEYITRNSNRNIKKYIRSDIDLRKVIKKEENIYSLLMDFAPIFNSYYEGVDQDLIEDRLVVNYNKDFALILDYLKTCTVEGHTVIAMLLLGMDIDLQNKTMDYLKECIELTKKDGKYHKLTIPVIQDNNNYNRNYAFTIFTCLSNDIEDTLKHMEAYCKLKQYEMQNIEYIAILYVVDDYNRPINSFMYLLDKPYDHNEQMEHLLKIVKSECIKNNNNKRVVYINGKKYDRNKACFCGSGKKIKNCHGK